MFEKKQIKDITREESIRRLVEIIKGLSLGELQWLTLFCLREMRDRTQNDFTELGRLALKNKKIEEIENIIRR